MKPIKRMSGKVIPTTSKPMGSSGNIKTNNIIPKINFKIPTLTLNTDFNKTNKTKHISKNSILFPPLLFL
jgi:hypothetical protein